MAQVNLEAHLQGDCAISADLSVAMPMGADLQGDSSLGANLSLLLAMGADLQGDSSLGAGIGGIVDLAAPLQGDSSLSADLTVTRYLQASLQGSSSLGATLFSPHTVRLSATLQGSSSLSASPSVRYKMGSHLLGSAVQVAAPVVRYAMRAGLHGSSSFAADLSVLVAPAVVLQVLATRVVPTGQPIFEQMDFFQGDGKTRQQGLVPGDLTLKLFVGAMDVPWALVSGTGVSDAAVTAGKVYFQEFEAGYYSVRFFPNVIGLWRIVLSWAGGDQGVSQSYDVQARAPFTGAGVGLRSSFTKPPGMS